MATTPCLLLLWRLNFSLLLRTTSQKGHWNCWLFSWTIAMCFCKLELREKLFMQIWQLYFFYVTMQSFHVVLHTWRFHGFATQLTVFRSYIKMDYKNSCSSAFFAPFSNFPHIFNSTLWILCCFSWHLNEDGNLNLFAQCHRHEKYHHPCLGCAYYASVAQCSLYDLLPPPQTLHLYSFSLL